MDVILAEKEAEKLGDEISAKGIENDERSSVSAGVSRKQSEDINWNRRTLRLAFSENPYERYKTKVCSVYISHSLFIPTFLSFFLSVCRDPQKVSKPSSMGLGF